MRSAIDTRRLRNALGCFPTGVTVVTANDPDGGYVGVTANSFSSVSLDPPLILWALVRSARSFEAFMTADWFAVNVLASDQLHLSRRFASRRQDKFEGLVVDQHERAPLIRDCVAWFVCRRRDTYDGGDHVIVLGEVNEFDYHVDKEALVFHRGEYAVPGGMVPGPGEDEVR